MVATYVLIRTFATSQFQPVHARVTLVLVALDQIPAQNEMLGNVVDRVADEAHCDIMPRHSPVLGLVQLILAPLFDGLKVHDAVVVEVLTREDLVLNAFWVNVRQNVLVTVPSSKTQVKASNESHGIINDNEFFMVSLFALIRYVVPPMPS